MKKHAVYILWCIALTIVVVPSFADENESAVREVRKDIEKMGLVEEFNATTEEIVGVGSSFSPVDVSASGWEEKYVELMTSARAKAMMEISKVLSANLSATRAVESYSRDNARYKATARVVRMRTEGSPIGCLVIARRQKILQGRIQVAVALKWSMRLEETAVKSFSNPQAIDDDELEQWAEGQELVSMVGPYFWTDGKGRSCYLGIGAAEVRNEGSLGFKSAMRMANIRARRYVAYSFLETITGQEDVVKTSTRTSSDAEVRGVAQSDYSFKVRSRVNGVMLPGMRQVYSTANAESPFTDRKLCLCVYALSAAEVKGEVGKREP